MIKLLSSGEIEVGMIIMAVGQKPYMQTVQTMFGEVKEVENKVVNPWFMGMPLIVIGVAGPIVAIQTNGVFGGAAVAQSPVLFFDTRLVDFVEVDKKYYESVWEPILQDNKDKKEQYLCSTTFSGGKLKPIKL